MKMEDILELEIIDIDYAGLGVAKIENKPVFIDNCLPGEIVLAQITKITKNLIMAKNLKIIKESSRRNLQLCEYYDRCGGCNLMHLKYDYQLEVKRQNIIQTIKKIAKIKPIVNSVVRNNKIFEYRNKVIVPFAEYGQRVVSGFYEEKTHNVVPIEKCLIEPLQTTEIIKFVQQYIEEKELTVYNESLHKGLFRNIMCRVTVLNEIMVVLVTTSNHRLLKDLAVSLTHHFSNISSVYLNINSKKTNVVLSQEFYLLYGKPTITEKILDLVFEVSPNSFLQVNHEQCEKLYTLAIDYAKLTGNEKVIDAYCGIGTISLAMALKAKHVYGIEIVEKAVEDAKQNAINNNIYNVDFICGKCEDKIFELVKQEKIDVIVFDPPRKGCDKGFLDAVITARIPKIVYISCKTSTFARDVEYLCSNGYELIEVTPVDLFSHSTHVECVARLDLKGPKKII